MKGAGGDGETVEEETNTLRLGFKLMPVLFINIIIYVFIVLCCCVLKMAKTLI